MDPSAEFLAISDRNQLGRFDPEFFREETLHCVRAPLRQVLIVEVFALGVRVPVDEKAASLRSALVSACPRSVSAWAAFVPMVAELKSKLISRSIFGLLSLMDCDLVAFDGRERPGRPVAQGVDEARLVGVASASRPRVTLVGFSALMICSAEGCSAASASPTLAGRARAAAKTTRANFRPVCWAC